MIQTPTVRVFACRACGLKWETLRFGNFRLCTGCSQLKKEARRTKTCLYAKCQKGFKDESRQNSRKYCSVECGYREKIESAGRVPPEGFLVDRVLCCPHCAGTFTPVKGNQIYCTTTCQEGAYAAEKDALRNKVCIRCGEPFRDESLKGNARAHDECSRKAWNIKADAGRPLEKDSRLDERRRGHRRVGGGRLDDIRTMKKHTASWWGRVAELIYAVYQPKAVDVVLTHGCKSPFDFDDPVYGRVDVKGSSWAQSPYGLKSWKFEAAGLHQSCDTVFVVGFSETKSQVEHLWLMPSANAIPVLTPDSKEYQGEPFDVSESWGLESANQVLQWCRALHDPEPVLPEDRFAWMDDLSYLNHTAPGHLGRRAEILYRTRYPTSVDVNRIEGPSAPYDFLDVDGTRVDVKSCREVCGREKARWSFTIRSTTHAVPEHLADIYSCLCLDATGEVIVHEFRVPAAAVGSRWLIHIYKDYKGTMWESYRVECPHG